MRRLLLVYIFTIVIPNSVSAQVTTGTTISSVDLTPLITWLIGAISAVLTAAVPIFIRYFFSKMGIDRNNAFVDMVANAASRGAGIGYNWILTKAPSSTPIEVKNEAVKIGLDYVLKSFPDYIKKLGISSEQIERMVDGELGKLFAVDPNVQVGNKINP